VPPATVGHAPGIVRPVPAAPLQHAEQPEDAAMWPPDEEAAMPHRPFRLNPVRLAGAGLWLAAVAVAAHAAGAHGDAADGTARSAAAVMAGDQHWLEAETGGDTAWLEQMLLPGYRSVNNRGVATGKADIIAHAAKNRGSDKARKAVEAWLKAHPSKQRVVLQGDTAILTFYDAALGPERGVRSVDIFVYEGGRWHALYSQHSGLAGG
jgi:hypothetical protein